MKVFSARVRGGTIVADAAVDLPEEGSTVTIVVDAAERSFDLSSEIEEAHA